jgi:hypothetical protein
MIMRETYCASVLFLQVTRDMTKTLEPDIAKGIQTQVSSLEKALTKAFEKKDGERLATLALEISSLGQSIRVLL